MLGGEGRPVGDGGVQAAVSGQRGQQARRSAVHGASAGGRRPLLADDALPAGNQGKRPRVVGKSGHGRARIRGSSGENGNDARAHDPARRCVSGDAPPISGGGAVVPVQPRSMPAGGRNGLRQDGAGAGVSILHRFIARAGDSARAPDPQLAGGNAAFPAVGRQSATRAHDPWAEALRPARSGRVHHALPASARVEERAADAAFSIGHLRRNPGAAPRGDGKSTPPRRCCRKAASALSGCPARRFTTAAAKSGTSSTFSTTTS